MYIYIYIYIYIYYFLLFFLLKMFYNRGQTRIANSVFIKLIFFSWRVRY